MMKKYNFQSLNDVPTNLMDYVRTVSGSDFETITVEEVNQLLTEVDYRLSWPYQDSGLDG